MSVYDAEGRRASMSAEARRLGELLGSAASDDVCASGHREQRDV